jgi:pimeloyl-ACP methyl ester carboxylesterase
MTETAVDTGPAALHYRDAGSGPAVLFIHGLISDHRTWDTEVERLAKTHRVIAPDLPGHGESAKLSGDYSLGAHAAALRDLLDILGIDRVTVVGHSLGGGIAMQLAYLFPERVNGMVLVSSGGLGPDLNHALRLATLPGSELVLPLLGAPWVRAIGNTAFCVLSYIGRPFVSASTMAAWSGMATFGDAVNRAAFLATSRSVIGIGGQSVSALPGLATFESRSILVVWGGRDSLIPSAHSAAISNALPHSVVEIFDDAGHFPHLDEPDRFHRLLVTFLESIGLAAIQGPAA